MRPDRFGKIGHDRVAVRLANGTVHGRSAPVPYLPPARPAGLIDAGTSHVDCSTLLLRRRGYRRHYPRFRAGPALPAPVATAADRGRVGSPRRAALWLGRGLGHLVAA